MKENEMAVIAELISDTLKERGGTENIAGRVKKLVSQFQTVKFTFYE